MGCNVKGGIRNIFSKGVSYRGKMVSVEDYLVFGSGGRMCNEVRGIGKSFR